jgi:pimeloyl-ACP methyl ester carboxylesterase
MKKTLVRGLITLIVGLQVLVPGGVREEPAHAAPGAPGYSAEDVRIDTGAVNLAGTLMRPAVTSGPVPAVVYVPGSGPADRKTTMMGRLESEFLASRGVAVLRYDKRGVGGSTGNWKRETFQERADDVMAMVQYLRALPWVDSRRVGLVGHSQGAYVAALAASQSSDIAFVVMLAGPGITVKEQTLAYERKELLLAGVPDEQAGRRVARLKRWLDLASRLGPLCRTLRLHYICYVVDYDPIPALEGVRVPVLAAFGELDTQVPPKSQR